MSDPAAVFSFMANHIWQSALLAAVLAALLAARSWLSAQARHTLSFASLIAAAVLPLAMLLPGNDALMRSVSSAVGERLPIALEAEIAPTTASAAETPAVEPAPPAERAATPETAQEAVAETVAEPVAVKPAARPTRTARFEFSAEDDWRVYSATTAGASEASKGQRWTSRPQTPPHPPAQSAPEMAQPASTALAATPSLDATPSDASATLMEAATKDDSSWLPSFALPQIDVALPQLDLDRRPAVIWSLVAIWLIGAAVLLGRTLVDAAAAERLRRRATPIALPRPLAHLVGDIDVRESEAAPGPMAAGLFSASIILPPRFVHECSPHELLGLLEHERAHVARGDLRMALVQRILTAILWWSPAMHWMSARVEEEREMACDEAAAARVGDARAFAKTLTEHAQAQLFWGWPRLVVGAARRRSQLGRRVRWLLDIAGRRVRPIGVTARACVGVLLAAIAATALATPRLIAQDVDDEDRSRADREAPRAAPAPEPAPDVFEGAEYAAELEVAQAEVEAAQEELVRAQERFNEAINSNAAGAGSDEDVREAAQEYADAQRGLVRATRDMQRALVTINVHGPGRRAAGVSVDVRGPTPEEIERIGETVEAVAEAFSEQMDDFDFSWDFDTDGEALVQLGDHGVVVPGFSVYTGWGGGERDNPLMTAVRSGDLEMVRVLVDAGADVNGPDDCGCALVTAVRMGQADMVEYLLEEGADPNAQIRNEGTPLMIAARSGQADIVRLLAEAGADVNAAMPDQETALMWAVRSGDVDLVRLLIELGADVEGGSSADVEDRG